MDFIWPVFKSGGFVVVGLRVILPVLFGSLITWAGLKFRARHFRNYRQKIYAVPHKKEPAKRKGLIMLISPNQIGTAISALKFHYKNLDYVWLICSDESLENKQKIENLCNAEHIIGNPKLIISCHVADVNDPLEYYAVIDNILTKDLKKYNLSADDVIADYTGMTAHASVGMALAAIKAGVSLQFIAADYRAKKPVAREPFEIETSRLKNALTGTGGIA